MPLNPFTKGGGDIPISDGGTGASNAADARTNLDALNEMAHDLPHQEALRRELRTFDRRTDSQDARRQERLGEETMPVNPRSNGGANTPVSGGGTGLVLVQRRGA